MPASLLDIVSRIGPIIQENAAIGERERRLSDTTVQALVDAGLFRLWLPHTFGGLELDPVIAMRVIEEVSRFDGAAGWNLQISVAFSLFLPWFPDEGVAEILTGKPDPVLGGTLFPPGRALRVKGGYRLTGRWPFISGCQHCSWFFTPALVVNEGKAAESPKDQAVQLLLAFRAEDAEILDTWHTMGMRGTGSHDIAVQDIFVPDRRTAIMAAPNTLATAFGGPLYRLSIWPAVAAVAPPALGIARAAIDGLVELSKNKTPQYTRTVLRETSVLQGQIANAEAHVGAGRAYLLESLREAWDTAQQGRTLNLEQKIKIQLATSYTVEAAVRAVDLVHQTAGSTAVRQEHAFERYFRDVHTISQNAFGSTSRYASVGKILVGLETDWEAFGL
jgi:indole-3-acetate monooxygenase